VANEEAIRREVQESRGSSEIQDKTSRPAASFVEAYVLPMHYVEASTLRSCPLVSHHAEGAKKTDGPTPNCSGRSASWSALTGAPGWSGIPFGVRPPKTGSQSPRVMQIVSPT